SDASTAKVSEWMTADPDTIGPGVEARAAFASLSERGYRHIPVVDGGAATGHVAAQKLVGIVSMRDLMRVAMIQPADAQAHEVPKGLEGVVVADTSVGDVRGLEGFYHYRQYGAVDLAMSRPIEDVWHLMFEGRLPTTVAEHAAAVEKYLISTVDHGFNASTFTARVITSTGADLGAAVVGAIGALSGPLHGGAPSRALQMLDEIGTPDRAEPWLRAAVERGDRLMGFGHRVYKTDDPRSLMLREVAYSLGGDKMELARHIEVTAAVPTLRRASVPGRAPRAPGTP